jgi:hypothetical protein
MEKSIFAELGLNKIPFYGKVFLTMFLLSIGCGYLLAVTNVLLNVGMSYNAIVDHYRGNEANMIPIPEFKELITHAHTHVLAMTMMFFTLGFVFMLTSANPLLKIVVPALSFFSILMDISSMFLVRFVLPQFAITILLAGMLIGVCALIEIVIPLYEMWLKKGDK